MSEIEHIADQINRTYLDGAWVTVSLHDLFWSFTAREAAARPVTRAHSVWEIALHLTFWHDAVRRRLAGELVDYGPEEDWPMPGEPTESNWRSTLDDLDRSHRELVTAVRAFDPGLLHEPVPGKPFTAYFMLHGVPQHDFYHGGQAAILLAARRQQRAGLGEE